MVGGGEEESPADAEIAWIKHVETHASCVPSSPLSLLVAYGGDEPTLRAPSALLNRMGEGSPGERGGQCQVVVATVREIMYTSVCNPSGDQL